MVKIGDAIYARKMLRASLTAVEVAEKAAEFLARCQDRLARTVVVDRTAVWL